MGLLGKINHTIEGAQHGVEHVVNEASHVVNKPVDAAANTVNEVYELQKKVIGEAQAEATKIISEAKSQADKIIADGIEKLKAEIEKKKCEIIANMFDNLILKLQESNKWYLKVIGKAMQETKKYILTKVYEAL